MMAIGVGRMTKFWYFYQKFWSFLPKIGHDQGIKNLRSLIGDHDLDHFFHDREMIAITCKNDRDLPNCLFPRSRSFGHLQGVMIKMVG